MLKTETKNPQGIQQQGENAPATKKTKWRNAAGKTGNTKHIKNVRAIADGRPTIDYMDHAPVHPVYLHTDGLFRPLPNSKSEPRLAVEKYYQANKVYLHCKWRGKHALNIFDQSVLMFLCQLAAQPSRAFHVCAADEKTAVLMRSLNVEGLGCDLIHIGIRTTFPEVVRGIGLSATGTNSTAVLESLNRLAATRMRRTKANADGSLSDVTGTTNLLGLVCGDDAQSIVLNTELSNACRRIGAVAWVNMREQRLIKSKPAKRLHAWLSNWASSRETRAVDLKLLHKHIWGNQPCTASATKSRSHTLRASIQEISQHTGWVCFVDEDKKRLMVRKPIFAGTKAVTAATSTIPAETASTTAERETEESSKSSTGVALQTV